MMRTFTQGWPSRTQSTGAVLAIMAGGSFATSVTSRLNTSSTSKRKPTVS
jgi:hypothetical protein